MDEFEALALAAAARKQRDAQAAPEPDPQNPDGTYGQPPEGMVTDPRTGQMTSRELMSNDMQKRGVSNAESAVIGGAAGATFGGADEAFGGIYAITPGEGSVGDRYDFGRERARAMQDASQAQNPIMHGGAEIAGAVSVPLGALDRTRQGAGLAMRTGQSIAAGTGIGTGYGFLNGEGGFEDRLDGAETGAKWGAVGGAAAPIIGAGVKKVADSLAGRKAIRAAARGAQETAKLRAQSGQAYDAFEGAGAEISPAAMARLRARLDAKLPQSGLGTLPGAANRTPGGQQILNTVGQMDDQVRAAATAGQNPAVPLKSIEELRRFAGDVAQDVNPIGRATADARMGSIAIDEIDDFVGSLQAADVPIGDPVTATEALKKARSLWAQASKTQLLDNVLEQQDNYLGGSASAIRNKVGSLLRNPKTSRQFSDAEKAILQKIIGGNAISRAIRLMGNGIGKQVQMAGGAGMGGIPGALAGMVTGELTGAIADKNAVKAAEVARAIIANGGIQSLPKAPDSVRQITEMLTRRAAVAGPQ